MEIQSEISDANNVLKDDLNSIFGWNGTRDPSPGVLEVDPKPATCKLQSMSEVGSGTQDPESWTLDIKGGTWHVRLWIRAPDLKTGALVTGGTCDTGLLSGLKTNTQHEFSTEEPKPKHVRLQKYVLSDVRNQFLSSKV